MSTKPNITTTHTRTAFLRLDEKEVARILAEAVASKAGLDLNGEGVTFKTLVSSRDTGTGIERYAEVTITQDLSRLPRPATE